MGESSLGDGIATGFSNSRFALPARLARPYRTIANFPKSRTFLRAFRWGQIYLPPFTMAQIKPFSALRPEPALAEKICELPYDVMSSEEARQIAAGNPLSFLHVSKPEIDLSPSVNVYSPEVYAKGRQNFQKLIAEGALRRDVQPCFYLYRQTMGSHSQIGAVAAASCEDYLKGIIKKHELTRPDKEDDRVRHIETLNAQTGPVFLVYRARSELDRFVAKRTALAPEIDFQAKDGVRHTAWIMDRPEEIRFFEEEFAKTSSLYIADGHHRSAAAARVYQSRHGAGQSDSFLSVIFPHNQVQILPYNRVLKDLNGLSAKDLLEKLGEIFLISPTAVQSGAPVLTGRHQMGLYLGGQWSQLSFRSNRLTAAGPIDALDVTLLQRQVLEPIFGITDPRTSQRIHFVGGIRGSAELEKLVNSGEFACAFLMFPTSIEELMSIADAGGIMPPKSTWFEPKLRDAMFCHLLGA
jgi:uncharacterized protein (DUF1015 family)